jgi:hypothetical protein
MLAKVRVENPKRFLVFLNICGLSCSYKESHNSSLRSHVWICLLRSNPVRPRLFFTYHYQIWNDTLKVKCRKKQNDLKKSCHFYLAASSPLPVRKYILVFTSNYSNVKCLYLKQKIMSTISKQTEMDRTNTRETDFKSIKFFNRSKGSINHCRAEITSDGKKLRPYSIWCSHSGSCVRAYDIWYYQKNDKLFDLIFITLWILLTTTKKYQYSSPSFVPSVQNMSQF